MSALPRSPFAIHLAMLINLLSIGSLMMAMPLGPDFVRELAMLPSHIGYLSGAATLAAAFSAALAAPWLDRLPRKRALVTLLLLRFTLLGSCALATTPAQLIALFMLSGLVAGPLGALLIAAVLDLLEPAERGRKLAYLSMGYSLAAIIAVPLALELAVRAGWPAPFLLFGLLGLLCALGWQWRVPATPRQPAPRGVVGALLRSPTALVALAAIALQMAGHFLLVPHLSHYFQFNLAFPREHVGLLYLFGGLASLVALRLGGVWIDRGRAIHVVLLASGGLALVTLIGFAAPLGLSPYLIFTLFMAFGAVRTSSTLTVVAGVPPASQRAGFMALQASIGNIAAGSASMASARYLDSSSDGRLIGFELLAWIYAVAGLVAAAGVLWLLRQQRREPQDKPSALAESA